MIVSTKEFWSLMCHPWFMRTSYLSGRIGQHIYITLEAPEDTDCVDQALVEIKHATRR